MSCRWFGCNLPPALLPHCVCSTSRVRWRQAASKVCLSCHRHCVAVASSQSETGRHRETKTKGEASRSAAPSAGGSKKKLRRPEDWQLAAPLTYHERLAVFGARHCSTACLVEGEPLCQADGSCGHLYCVRALLFRAGAWQLRVRSGLLVGHKAQRCVTEASSFVQEWGHTIFGRKTLVCDEDWLTDRLLEGCPSQSSSCLETLLMILTRTVCSHWLQQLPKSARLDCT